MVALRSQAFDKGGYVAYSRLESGRTRLGRFFYMGNLFGANWRGVWMFVYESKLDTVPLPITYEVLGIISIFSSSFSSFYRIRVVFVVASGERRISYSSSYVRGEFFGVQKKTVTSYVPACSARRTNTLQIATLRNGCQLYT